MPVSRGALVAVEALLLKAPLREGLLVSSRRVSALAVLRARTQSSGLGFREQSGCSVFVHAKALLNRHKLRR